jgi:hypothetical protein
MNCTLFRVLIAMFLAAVCQGVAAAPATPVPATPAPKIDPAVIKPFEGMLDAALAAYNAGDATRFFADFSTSAVPPPEPRIFVTLVEGVYKADFGKYLSKKLNAKESAPDPSCAALVYDAIFEKQKAKLSANFIREPEGLKIVQIRIEPM